MRICYLIKNIDAGGWYRCLFPAHELVERGHWAQPPAVTFHRPDGSPAPLFPDGQLPEGWLMCAFGEWPDADIYVFQMANEPPLITNHEVEYDGIVPKLTLLPGLVEKMQAAGKKVVVEVDDDLLHVPAYNPFSDDPKWFHRACELADAISVSTPALATCYSKLNKNITVLRNRLHWPMWSQLPPVYERREWSKLRVGWMGILEYHRNDLDVLKPWLVEWLKNHPDVEFVSCGGADVHDYLGIPDAQRVTTDRTDFRHLELAYITSVMDIGLVPLEANHFNERKSYLKGLEYSACGIVPIATPTEQYKELITHGEDGYLCAYPNQWIKALDELWDSGGPFGAKGLLNKMGKAAYEKAQGWTYANHIQEWEQFYESVAGDTVAGRMLWTAA